MKNISVKCFLKAAELLSITKAAEELYMARQTVSRQIALMEQELDCQLFIRTARSIKLTPEGQKYYLFFSYARDEYYRARKIVSEDLGETLSEIRLGCVYGIDLEPTIMHFFEEYLENAGEDVDIVWEYADHKELHDRLLNGEYDLVIIDQREEGLGRSILGYDYTSFVNIQPIVAVQKQYYTKFHPNEFFKSATCCLSEEYVANEKYDLENSFRTLWFNTSGIVLENIKVLPNRESVERMVRQGGGFMITTNYSEFSGDDTIIKLPFGKEVTLIVIYKISGFSKVIPEIFGRLRGEIPD